IFKEINHKFFISWSLTIKATLYSEKGEVARSIPIFQQSLTIVKELKHKLLTSGILNNMADTYRMNGELEKALECSKSSLEIFSQFGNTKPLANYHDFLIQILIEMGDIKQARYYFNQLEQLNNQLKDRTINEIYILNKASMLKESPRISDKGKAQESLKQLLEDGDLSLEGKKRVLIKLCELLLSELQMTGDLEVLKEVESFITQLLAIAEKSRSYWIWGETFLLQAKLALTSLNLKQARRLLTQGQKIAEKYGLNLLAKKISNEHDELLKKLKIWENLKVSDSPLDARVRLSGLNEQIEKMIQKRVINVPDLSDEVPVLLFIVSEGGTPFFSQSFEEDKNFEDHLFGGFLSAINSFMDEMFSEGLDRASFGDYTLLMNSISPFFMCYIFKGQSYTAHQRLLYFIDKLRSDKEVWQSLELYHLKNQEIQLQDIPSLETLIKDVFIEKKIVENW
ncbi:MAG: tetratricopeptide repeat protein, partial [Candidatus Heimdallarchaeota archaeon]